MTGRRAPLSSNNSYTAAVRGHGRSNLRLYTVTNGWPGPATSAGRVPPRGYKFESNQSQVSYARDVRCLRVGGSIGENRGGFEGA